ncbi:MAG: alpha-galactosidase [Bacteroidetes bacterium]|nr:alpha-galactosidase [Bacteroidota bacterium]
MKKLLLLFIAGIILSGCSEDSLPPLPENSNITGLASPVRLGHERTQIPFSDFFLEPEMIQKVEIPGLDEDLYFVEGEALIIDPTQEMKAVFPLLITADGITEAIPVFCSGKQLVEFSFDSGDKKYERVTVAGEFNGWTPGRPEFDFVDGIWTTSLMLNPGTYQYQLVLDGEWMLDPANPDKIDNNMGGYNSLLSVGLDIKDKVPLLFTVEFEDDDIEIATERKTEGVLIFWQNILLPQEYYEMEEDGEIEIGIPEAATKMQRSFIRVWAWNEYGISNDLLIPLEYGNVLDDPAKVTRHDMHSMILYNAFVDRFYDADTSNNRPLNTAEVLPPADYHGGDIKGVTQKIKDGYFRELGVNTIWVSPLVKNPEGAFGFWPDPPSKFSGYHGYWPVSFTEIDNRYGTEEDLHQLVKAAHEQEMNVLLDFVANHVHQEHPLYQQHPEWATELYLPDGTLNTERWDEYRLTTWFDVFLPTLDLSKPEVYEMLSDSAVYWIKKYNLDGLRHDATKHIPEVFWRTLTRKLKEQIVEAEGRPVYQIGETYGGAELISSYVGTGMLDAQFDFNVYDDALAVLIRPDEPFTRLNASLVESMQYYGSHNLMGYISGNQDRGRFTSYAGAGLRFSEDAKLAGWTRDVKVGDKRGYLVTALLFAFNMTIPGLPVIYYGDEIGMPGGNDPDSRRMMRFKDLSDEELKLKSIVEKLTALRRNSMALMYGDFEPLLVMDDTYAYCRTYFEEIVIVVMNKGAQTKNLTFKLPDSFHDIKIESRFGTIPGLRDGRMSVTLGGRSFDVIKARN